MCWKRRDTKNVLMIVILPNIVRRRAAQFSVMFLIFFVFSLYFNAKNFVLFIENHTPKTLTESLAHFRFLSGNRTCSLLLVATHLHSSFALTDLQPDRISV